MTRSVLIAASRDAPMFSSWLRALKFVPRAAGSEAAVVAQLREESAQLVVVDSTAPEFDPVTLIARAKEAGDASILAVVERGDSAMKRAVLNAGADDYVTAPVTELDLGHRVAIVLRVRELVAELARRTNALDGATTVDPVTAAHNMWALKTHLAREFARARRYKRPLSLLAVCVDAQGSAEPGPPKGPVLVDVAGVLRTELREADILGRSGSVFWVIAPETPIEDAVPLADRLRRAVNSETTVTVSIGIGAMPARQIATPDQFLDAAEAAAALAQGRGRNCCQVAEAETS